ncbi:hypothetical protein HPB50_014858 [Hyalomma asiaticum]|uniref:Uncharacterized protein n=1 Tax=Hyalomma asiaticum TaxID=266040 RepID=A0ACB7SY00_HYAAI|nr:hypothetical protein HPB50_014858 [Hyalomma asiaticum]
MATASNTCAGILCRNLYAKKGGAVKEIFERVAAGDNISDFSNLSESDEEEWTAATTGAVASSSPPGRN